MTRRRVLLTAVLLVGCVVTATAVIIDAAGTRVTALDAPVIIVLGARVEPSGRASPTLEARVLHAVTLMRADSVLIISGGVGTYGASEADVGAELAIARGIPDQRIWRERESHSTRENAERTAVLLREAGVTNVIVVSDPYHLPRARFEFERLGFTVQTSPVTSAPRHLQLSERVYWTLREIPALVKAWLTTSSPSSNPPRAS